MPVYKLAEKRLAKKQRQQEDSRELEKILNKLERAGGGSESASEGEDEDEDGDDSDDEFPESVGTLDSEDDSSDDEDEEEGVEEEEDQDEEQGNDDDEDDDDFFTLTIDQVSSAPTYSFPSPPYPPNSSACVLCPGRIFKNEHMVTEHVGSKGHKRALKRWEERVKLAESGQEPFQTEDPREVVDEIMAVLERQREGLIEIVKPTSAAAEGETPSKKRKRGKKERQEAKAKALVEAAKAQVGQSTDNTKASKKAKGAVVEDTAASASDVKLNRKARRLAAKQGLKTQ